MWDYIARWFEECCRCVWDNGRTILAISPLELNFFLIFFRWTQSSHTPGQSLSSETSARSLVEFCELVDFLLDIVSLVGKLKI